MFDVRDYTVNHLSIGARLELDWSSTGARLEKDIAPVAHFAEWGWSSILPPCCTWLSGFEAPFYIDAGMIGTRSCLRMIITLGFTHPIHFTCARISGDGNRCSPVIQHGRPQLRMDGHGVFDP